MLHTALRTPVSSADGPSRLIHPRRPFVWAFALADPPALADRILPAEVITVAVADGAPDPVDSQDWFAARIPVIPPVTGPLHVIGVLPGDLLAIEVLALEAEHPARSCTHRITVTVPRGRTAGSLGPTRVAIPVGEVVKIVASHPGGLVSFGPVLAGTPGDHLGIPVAARVTVCCTVVRPRR